ncbi:hypothetical protein RHS01_06786 [Rhizoctonia solani]|uniref:Uncharacterized protein n=1 Tax=Rhizoctonia solani TaxID=456999 RepID=A0A8H7ICS5_9AGAM|nr:hypothetical protein RHS01_06786 [Rhizoctonia solani]
MGHAFLANTKSNSDLMTTPAARAGPPAKLLTTSSKPALHTTTPDSPLQSLGPHFKLQSFGPPPGSVPLPPSSTQQTPSRSERVDRPYVTPATC